MNTDFNANIHSAVNSDINSDIKSDIDSAIDHDSHSDWIDVAAAADVPDGEVVAAQVQGRAIALVRLGAELHAIDATCTHGNADLCGGFVEADGSIECPLHQGRFDVRTGRALCAPLTQDLAVHPLRLLDGRIWLRLLTA